MQVARLLIDISTRSEALTAACRQLGMEASAPRSSSHNRTVRKKRSFLVTRHTLFGEILRD